MEWLINWIVGGLWAASLFVVFVAALVLLLDLVSYILISWGLYRMATRQQLAWSWLAWIPVARHYILGLLLSKQLKINPSLTFSYLQYILPGLVLLSWLGSGSSLGGLFSLLSFAAVFMSFTALFKLYRQTNAWLWGLLTTIPCLRIAGGYLLVKMARAAPVDPETDTTLFP